MSDNNIFGGDARLKKSSAPTVRDDRAAADAPRTQMDGTALTMEERRRLIRSEWAQDILPNPPADPKWHYCWLSTTNSTDPIYKRMQKGYQPVKVSEIPGFAQFTVREGEFEGCVACNEMLLFKIEQELYQEIMSFFHFDRPMQEEEILKANATGSEQDRSGRPLLEEEGFDKFARPVQRSHFS